MIKPGIFAVYKPKGPTSYDIIRQIKKATGEKKVGHAGTLDPLARGVLVVAVGRNATKQLSGAVAAEKEYLATVQLGENSITDDAEGEKQKIDFNQIPTEMEVKKALNNFQGSILQTPPAFSAIKRGGVKSYKLARQGKKIDLGQRRVEVKEIELLKYVFPQVQLRVVTGSGFYVRSLARDLGEVLKTGGYLSDLERTRVGQFTKDQSLNLSK